MPGSLLIARFGLVPALIVGLLLNAVGSALRRALPDVTALYVSSIVMAAGRFHHAGRGDAAFGTRVVSQANRVATAVYTTGLLIGEILAAALTIPLVLPLVGNSWRLSFVFWSVPVCSPL